MSVVENQNWENLIIWSIRCTPLRRLIFIHSEWWMVERRDEERCNQTVRGNRSALRHRVLDLMTVCRRMQKVLAIFAFGWSVLLTVWIEGAAGMRDSTTNHGALGNSTWVSIRRPQKFCSRSSETRSNWLRRKKWTYIHERNQWFIRGMHVMCKMYVWRVANSLGLENVSLVNDRQIN